MSFGNFMAMGVCKYVPSLKDVKVLTADLLLPVVLGGPAPFTCEIQRSMTVVVIFHRSSHRFACEILSLGNSHSIIGTYKAFGYFSFLLTCIQSWIFQ